MTETTTEMACSLDSEARKDRRAFFRERLLADALRTIRTKNGLRLIFRNDPAVRREIETLVDLERQCCGFLDFALTEDPDRLELSITGPPGARAVLDEMASAVSKSGPGDRDEPTGAATGGFSSLLKYTGLAGVWAGVTCLLICELPVVLTVIGLSGLGAWFAMAGVRLLRDPVLNMRSFLNRNKTFYLDNTRPDAPNNRLCLDPADLSRGELYLWAWCETYLRFDALVEEFAIAPAVEIRTEDLMASKVEVRRNLANS